MKLTGAQLKAFWAAPLENQECWFEDEVITVDGVYFDGVTNAIEDIPDIAQCTLAGGFVANDPKERSVESLAKSWLKAQVTTQALVEFDKGREQEVREALKAMGVRVVA